MDDGRERGAQNLRKRQTRQFVGQGLATDGATTASRAASTRNAAAQVEARKAVSVRSIVDGVTSQARAAMRAASKRSIAERATSPSELFKLG